MRLVKPWSRNSRRQFHDLDVAEVDFGSFRFQAQITPLLRRAADAVNKLVVHRELNDAIDGDDIIGVLFSPPLAAVFDGLAPLASRVIWHRSDSTDPEEFTVDIGVGRSQAIHLVQLDPVEFEHLDLNAIGQAALRIGAGTTPYEYAGVSSRLNVHPLDVQHEILILLLASHDANGMARADQHTVANLPCVFDRVDVDPSCQVLAIEEIPELRDSVARRPAYASSEQERC